MAMIQISNLNLAGNDLLTDSENFLTDLQDVDSTQVIGGGGHGKGGRGGSKGGRGKGSRGSKGSKGGRGGYGGYGGYGCH